MKALDTTVLARFFVDDPDDAHAVKQRPAAVAALSERGFVSVTVLLEFEWVMRGFYELGRPDIVRLLLALASIDHISVEDRRAVLAAIEAFKQAYASPVGAELIRDEEATIRDARVHRLDALIVL